MTTDETPFRYTDHFIENQPSARKIVPVLLELIDRPQSAVDLGGGTGAWCKVLREHGVGRVLCIDDARIAPRNLLVEPSEFRGADLAAAIPEPVPSDLALCLEVVEHLRREQSEPAVDFLTRSADLVLFSASIPGQPDDRHINEQPPSFWKRLFGQRGFQRLDILRPRLIGDPSISYWYRQNLFLFANAKGLARVKTPSAAFDAIPDDFELVHASLLAEYRAAIRPHSPTHHLRNAWQALRGVARRRLQRPDR